MPKGGIHDDFIERTREVWQQHSESQVSAEDAREIVENVAGFFTLLAKWEAARDAELNPDHETTELGADRSELTE